MRLEWSPIRRRTSFNSTWHRRCESSGLTPRGCRTGSPRGEARSAMRSETCVTVGDDVGFCHGLIHLTGNRTDGSESNVWFRNTLCLRKAGDAWKIVHGHESVPMYMDGSFKAAI